MTFSASARLQPKLAARRVAILGGGIMGACVALFLARRGFDVAVFDRESAPLASASRWNEGKIHLGYLYGADPTMRTARLLVPGGLLFRRLISELVGSDVAPHTTSQDDIYLIHRQSVVDAEAVRAQFAAVSDLVRNHAHARWYLADASGAHARELSQSELAAIADQTEIVAAFEVPERSVSTPWVADRLVDALWSEPRVSLYMGVTISGAHPVDSAHGPWRVVGAPHLDERFDFVVNALWDGRLAIDRTAGLELEAGWSHRYRLSVFARTSQSVTTRSALVAFGPFGDVKNYNDRDFYLSWYPTGLIAQGHAISLTRPSTLTANDELKFVREVGERLAKLIPGAAEILAVAEDVKVRGGFVFAQGRGSLANRKSTLHRRDRFGVRRLGNYYSVDTGKYSTAPWMAANLANAICGD
jgi:glycine/D-amino acid oxidase-like deaminating enzyme